MSSERRRALIVGIDDYPGDRLTGCVNDALTIAALLRTHEDGSPNFAVKEVAGPGGAITRSSLRANLDRLFGAHDDVDVALFYFAGHGTETALGGFLVTPDARRYDEGVPLIDVLALVNRSRARECVVIVDSCHSGHLGTLPALGNDQAHLREGVSLLAASQPAQVAVESNGRGLFTTLVCGALNGGAADVLGGTTIAAVYAYVDQALDPWQQRPLFRANVSRLISLRNSRPAVAPEILRRLPSWFPTADFVYPLDPSYEPDAEPRDAGHEQIFADLQRCRAAKLLEPVGAEHMYFAAMNSTGCRLTPLGGHYRRLAMNGRL